MVGGVSSSCYNIVKENAEKDKLLLQKITDDIGGYFVSNTTIYLRELLPSPYNLLDNNFIIDKAEHVFFEIITQKHGNVWKNRTEFIKSKIDFHKRNNKKFKWDIDSNKRILILIYNGADSVVIGRIFRKLCILNGRGIILIGGGIILLGGGIILLGTVLFLKTGYFLFFTRRRDNFTRYSLIFEGLGSFPGFPRNKKKFPGTRHFSLFS